MNDLLLKVDSLRKFFKIKRGFPNPVTVTVRAVDEVSITVNRGEALGLVGESGCGKSTVGYCILRLLEPDAGEVLMNGENILNFNKKQLRQFRKKMQIIFQDPYSSLNPKRTVRKTLTEPMRVHKICAPAEMGDRVQSLLNEVGLPLDAADKFPHEFSGGQRQRIGIARALLFKPDLIIADEPVSALDVSIQASVLMLLQDLQKKHNLSYIFISHDLAVVRHFCQRLAVMYLGRIVEQGPVSQVFGKPLHPYTELIRDASPIPDPTLKREIMRLEGEVPSPIKPPPGCYFHPRCSQSMDICKREYPPWVSLDSERGVACHLYLSNRPIFIKHYNTLLERRDNQ